MYWLPALRPEPAVYHYTSPKSGTQYIFNATPDTMANAEAACNAFGGHLATWNSLSEQQEVERGFLYNGGLIGSFHQDYWLGLTVDEWPGYVWVDKTVPAPANKTYQHWGKGEPNDRTVQCTVANWNSSFSSAWAWRDMDCSQQHVYICEKSREWLRCSPYERSIATASSGCWWCANT